MFRELAAEFDGRVRFLEVDMDESSGKLRAFLGLMMLGRGGGVVLWFGVPFR